MLPRKSKEKPVKKTPSGKASTKKVGATGKTRYGYPQEQSSVVQPKKAPSVQDPVQVPKTAKPKEVDPMEFAAQLQIPVETLRKIAERFSANKKLGGRSGFVKFMRTRLEKVVDKHRLDGDFFTLLYEKLTAQPQGA